MTTRAALFDLGNTLWHIPERPPADAIRQETVHRIFSLLASWNIEPVGELRFLGRDIRLAVGAADKAAYESDCVSPDIPSLVQNLMAERNIEIALDQSAKLWETWNLEGSFFGRRLFDDALPMLRTLRDRGFRLGCVTNRPFGGQAFVEEVSELGLAEQMDVMSVSCEIGYMKPHRRIFEHALEALGVAPEHTVMVGDSLRADVAGAQALGMTGVWRRHHEINETRVDGIEPDYEVEELEELLDLPCFADDGDTTTGV